MQIELKNIPVRELVDGYADNDAEGVVGYHGNLDIRPKYQREFVYKDKQRDAVIDTINKGFPLNVLYWADNGGGRCEVIDGQQRILSICQYCAGDFSIDYRAFHNLTKTEQSRILDYKLMVYFCRGTDKEKLEWFETINIAGERLTNQELRNAVYSGSWVTDAKRYFSRHGCPAQDIGGKYVNGAANRQELLEAAIKWASNGNIQDYMSKHQHDSSAEPLWDYFEGVIRWAKATFSEYRKEMRGVDWGALHRIYGDKRHNPDKLEAEIKRLMEDDAIGNKRGIYAYVLSRNEKHLHIRAFSPSQKRAAYERQNGVCAKCGKAVDIDESHADHITPWSKGGKTAPENCQVLCADCNRRKSDV